MKKSYRILFIVLLFLFFFNCKRSVFEDPSNTLSNNNIAYSTIDNNDCSTEKLFPKNGQSGGIGTVGNNNGFRAFIWKEQNSNWCVKARVVNFVENNTKSLPITDAKVWIYCKMDEKGNYQGFLMKKGVIPGDYSVNQEIPLIPGERCGYFHVLSNSRGIDFKIGFSIAKLEIENQMVINGITSKPGDDKTVPVVNTSGLTVSVKCPNALYYKVTLIGKAGNYTLLNYYTPTGIINVPANVTSTFSKGTFGMLYISPHQLYIAKGFETPAYIDNTKQISMISVNYGNQITIGANLIFK